MMAPNSEDVCIWFVPSKTFLCTRRIENGKKKVLLREISNYLTGEIHTHLGYMVRSYVYLNKVCLIEKW
jgi:hypothetical protein